MRWALKSIAALLALLAATPWVSADDQPMIGAPAPGFSLSSLTGNTVSLADFRSKIVVLHFGAGW